MQIEPARLQQPAHGGEIGVEIRRADVLEHADRADLVETLRPLQPRIVGQLERHLVGEPEFGRSPARNRDLFLGQRHADDVDAVVAGGVQGERAPAAADVEQRLARLQPQLAADHIEFVDLRLIEAVAPVVEIAAGVDHLRVEPQPIEGVGDVVVMGDVLRFSASLPSLSRSWATPSSGHGPPRGVNRNDSATRSAAGVTQALAQFAAARLRPPGREIEQRAVDDVESPRRPQIGERRQARRARKPGDGAFVGDGDRQRVGRPVGRDERAVPQPKAEFEAEAAMCVGEQRCEPRQPFFRPVHIVSVAATSEDRVSREPTVRRDAARTGKRAGAKGPKMNTHVAGGMTIGPLRSTISTRSKRSRRRLSPATACRAARCAPSSARRAGR